MTDAPRPAIALPSLDLSDLDLPDINLPDINLPALNLSDSLSSIAALANQIQSVINGAIAHPIWAIALLLFIITLIQILADLIKRLIKAALTSLLKLPLTLSQWIWQRASAPGTSSASSTPNASSTLSSPSASSAAKRDQLEQLVAQLNGLRAEQDQVIENIRLLLAEPAKEKDSQPVEAKESETKESETHELETEARKSSATVSPEVG